MARRSRTDERTYREPLATTVGAQLGLVVVVALPGPIPVVVRLVIVGCVGVFGVAVRRLRSLTLTPKHLVVRGLLSRRVVPWDTVIAIHPASWIRGGIVVVTTAGSVRSVCPHRWLGGVAVDDVAAIREWWHAHAPDGPRPRPPRPPAPRPVHRSAWRLARVAPATALAGLAVAILNAAALLRPYGEWSAGSLVVTKPGLDGIEALLALAVVAGTAGGAVLYIAARPALQSCAGGGDGPAPPDSSADSGGTGDVLRPSWVPPLMLLAVGSGVALVQWVGMAPAVGALTMTAAGVAAGIGGMALARVGSAAGPVVLRPRPRRANCF